MSKRRFTKEQIEDLLKNKNVVNCSDKAITYSKDFKAASLKRHFGEGLPPKWIFKEAGFDLGVIGIKTPKNCIDGWSKVVRKRGDAALLVDNRGKSKKGGRPKTKHMTDAQKIEYLEATVAYLKAENDFLIKLRAGKAE